MECHDQTPDMNITKNLRLNFFFLTTFRLRRNRRFFEKNLITNFYPASNSSSANAWRLGRCRIATRGRAFV